MEQRSDPLDIAAETQLNEVENAVKTMRAIKQMRERTNRALIHTGFCFNCAEPVGTPHLYCDADCRADYEERLLMKRRQGR